MCQPGPKSPRRIRGFGALGRLRAVSFALVTIGLCGISTTSASAAMSGTWCGTSTDKDRPGDSGGAPVVKVVYAHPRDRRDRLSHWGDLIQWSVRRIEERLIRESGGTKTVHFDTGTRCGAQFVDIQTVELPGAAAEYQQLQVHARGRRVDSEVETSIGGFHGRNVLLFADETATPDATPFGTSGDPDDDRPGPENLANAGGYISRVWGNGRGGFVERPGDPDLNPAEALAAHALHELTHAFGAVQRSAPHGTADFHCSDSFDVMCNSFEESRGGCPSGTRRGEKLQHWRFAYDCNHDDYFSPSPEPGSWLASHWNVYNVAFLCPPVACEPAGDAPTARIIVRPPHPEVGSRVTLDASATTSTSPVMKYMWDLDGDGAYEVETGTSPRTSVSLQPNAEGIVDLRVKVLAKNGTGDISIAPRFASGISLGGTPKVQPRRLVRSRGLLVVVYAPRPTTIRFVAADVRKNVKVPEGTTRLRLKLRPPKQRRFLLNADDHGRLQYDGSRIAVTWIRLI